MHSTTRADNSIGLESLDVFCGFSSRFDGGVEGATRVDASNKDASNKDVEWLQVRREDNVIYEDVHVESLVSG